MNTKRSLLPALTLTLTLTLITMIAVAAPGTPDFTGTWQLNTDRGENLGMVAAIKEKLVITQTAEKMDMDFESRFMGSTTRRKVSYDLTGKPVTNTAAMGEKGETVARWVDGKLVTTWTTEGALPDSKNVKTETRSLSADGRVMTVQNARPGKDTMVMVYEKQ
jgi:hypothetical protein